MAYSKSAKTEEKAWKRDLKSAVIVTQDWKCQVTMLVESDTRDTAYFEKFNEASKDEKRMVVKSITYEETINMVKQIGAGKDISPQDQVFEEAFNFMKQGNPIPEETWALLIKHQVLTHKRNDIDIKKAKQQLDEGLKCESLMMMNLQTKGACLSKDDKKFHTDLRKLGEEWKDKIYIEDFPKDGPELYIALIGFRKCNLIQEILKINIPLVAVVKVDTGFEPLTVTETEQDKISLSNSTSSHSKVSKFSPEIAIFWEDLQFSKANQELTVFYKGVAFISFLPPYKESILVGKTEQAIVYDEILYLLYDIQDLTRQHKNYLSSMKIIHVDEVSNEKIQKMDMTVYNNILDSVPLECTTITVVVHAMVSQIDQTESNLNNLNLIQSKSSVHVSQTDEDSTVLKAQKKINAIFEHKKFTDRIYSNDSSQVNNEQCVKLVPWGNFVELIKTCISSDCVDIEHITKHALSLLPIPKSWDIIPKQSNEALLKLKLFHECMKEHSISQNNAARLLNLMCCKKLGEEKFYYDYQLYHKHMHQSKKCQRSVISPIPSRSFLNTSSFTYGENPKVNQINFSMRCVQNFASNINFSKSIQPDDVIDILKDQRQMFEIELKETNYNINDYISFEEFSSCTMLQALNKAYFEFNTCNIKYCSVTDKIIVVFFNRIIDNMNEYDWRRYISSPICLRDFFDYVFDEEYDWIVAQEQLHDLLFLGPLKMSSDEKLAHYFLEDHLDYENDLILNNSLKYSYQNTESSTQKSYPTSGTKNETKQINSTNEKSPNKVGESPKTHSDTNVPKEKDYTFSGYDLGDECILTSGKTKSFISKDGTGIYVSIYNNFDDNFYISSCITTSNYDIFVHNTYNPIIKRIDDVEKIRFSLKNGMNLTFSKSKSLPNVSNSFEDITYQPYHFLNLSWPNGLLVEPVWRSDNNLPIYIKQQLRSNSNELYRCFTQNGEIIIYKGNGDIQILCPDSSIYLISQSADGYTSNPKEKAQDSIELFLQEDDLSSENLNSETAHLMETTRVKKNLLSFLNYDATLPDGTYCQIRNGDVVFEDRLLVRTATDFLLGEVYTRRMDGTNNLLNKDGVSATTFSDGSKITSYFILETSFFGSRFDLNNFVPPSAPVWSPSGSTILNERSIPTIDESASDVSEVMSEFLDGAQVVSIVYVLEHPDYASVVVNSSTRLVTINLPQKIVINIQENGSYKIDFENQSTIVIKNEELTLYDTKCFDCMSQSITKLNLAYSEEINNAFFVHEDCFGKIFTLNYSGDCFLSINKQSEGCCGPNNDGYCCKSLHRKNRRFFALKRDLSGEEYLHRETTSLYKNWFANKKWSCFNSDQDIFEDQIYYDTSMFPVNHSMTNSWYTEPLVINAKPKNLKRADLKEYENKGFYSWMRPFPRTTMYYDKRDSQINVKPIVPKTMIIRIIRKLIPQDWNIVDNMKMAVEKYTCLVKKKKESKQSIPLTVELDDRLSDRMVELIALDMYEDIIKTFDKQIILTNARKVRNNTGFEHNIKKYLEQRSKERVKEQFYRDALREKIISNYEYPVLNGESTLGERNIIEQ